MESMEGQRILFAFGLTLVAGLSTGIGSAIAFVAKRTNTKLLSLALGFSAGVMILAGTAYDRKSFVNFKLGIELKGR